VRPPSIWKTLGVAQTDDRAEIRRAYSRRLKVTHPEDDAEGFKALREAYERALAYADQAGRRRAVAQAPQEEESEPEPPPPPSEPDDWNVDLALSAADPPPEADPIVGQIQAEEVEHQAAFQRLHDLVEAQTGDSAEMLAALDALLATPAMDSMRAQEVTEYWLASLIVNRAPHADALVEPVIARFGWDHARVGVTTEARIAVLTRRDALSLLSDLRRSGSLQGGAYRALTEKPKGRRLLLNRVTPRLPGEVRALLDLIYAEHQDLLAELDSDALAWWRTYFEKPRFGPAFVATAIIGPILLAKAVAQDGLPGLDPGPAWGLGYVISLVGVVGGLNLWLFGLARPRARWRQDWRWRAPAWLRLGWAPAILVVLAAAAVAPPSPWATGALGVVAALILGWACITGEVDERPGEGRAWVFPNYLSIITLVLAFVRPILAPGMTISWQLRAVFAYLYLALFWTIVLACMPIEAWLQVSLPLLAAAAAFVLGGASLTEAWQVEVSPKARRLALLGLGTVTAATPFLLWWAAPGPTWTPVAAALVAILTLVHKVPAANLIGRAYTLRDLVMRFGWFGWALASAAATDVYRQGNPALLWGGMWLLTGVAATVIGALVRERPVKARPGFQSQK
jgi:hypothetical protein